MHQFYRLKNIIALLFVGLFLSNVAMAQSKGKGGLKGRVLNKTNKTPFNDVQISVLSTKLQSTANAEGYFDMADVPAGDQSIVISGPGITTDTVSANIAAGSVTDMGDILATPGEQSAQSAEIPTISLEENTSQDDENSSASSQSSVGFYAANQDPFLYTASIVFGPFRFKPRGYDNADVEINGFPLQDLESGFASTSVIAGLNDVFRDRNITYGLKPAEYSFGTVKGSTFISATAADQRAGSSVSYRFGNGGIQNRIMLTHSSGLNKKGWAYSLSASKSWANEGYVPGTFFDGYSFYGAVSKVVKKGQFNLTAFGSPSSRGKSTAETAETYDITGNHFYNAAWGYQNGEKRNAHVATAFQPVIIANYTYRPSDNTRWNTAIGYEFGNRASTNLDWYHGYSPNPTYYKNMPTFYLYGDATPVPAEAAAVDAELRSNHDLLQLQWDNFYQGNRMNTETVYNVNGIAGNNVTGRRSIHILNNSVDAMKKLSFNSNIAHVVNEHLTLSGALTAVNQTDEYYKEAKDLLGGDFFLNYNQFADLRAVSNPAFTQNNLNNPNQLIRKGDRYGYDYTLRAFQIRAFGQAVYSYKQFEMFGAAEGGMISFSREGMMKNGLFPDHSFGKSETHSFTTYKVKGGLVYNVNPKNSVYMHAGFFTDAPKIDNSYIADKNRDFLVDGVKTYTTKSFELGYIFKSPVVNCRLTGYVNDVTGNTLVKRFFNDDPEFNSFVNFVMQNVNTRSTGIEFVAGFKVLKQLSVTAVAAVGQSFYTDNPDVSIYLDNSPSLTAVNRSVYLKNYYLGVGPQSIYSLAFKYSPANNWHLNLNLNYMDRNFVEVNPERRTAQAIDLVPVNSTQYHNILDQEKLAAAFTADISVGKSFSMDKYLKIDKNHKTLNVNVGINNILNNQDIITTGFEQLRYDFNYRNPLKFQNKYVYGYGTNFYITIGLKF